MARRLRTWRNLPAAPGDRGRYMRSVQCGRLGEERDLLMVPVNKDLARRGEDIRGATL